MHLLQVIQDSALADWVRVSEWGYPIILTLHSLGLALVVGVLVVINLRIIGFVPALALRSMRPLMTLVWCGLAVNLTTGCILFTADAIKFFESPTFRCKMLSIALGIGAAVYFSRTVLGSSAETCPETRMPMPRKIIAAASVAVWIIAISLGRYVAYE